MKPQSMKARRALNKSENSSINNNDATCFDFNELLATLDAIDSRVEIPIGSSSAYDFTSLSKALSVAEKDDKSKEAMLETRYEPCRGSITGFFKGLILDDVDNKIGEACLMVREVLLQLRDEYGCDISSLLKTKEAGRKFLNGILKIRDECYRDITNAITGRSMGLTVAEAEKRIQEAVANFRGDVISLRTLRVAAGHNEARERESRLKFQEALKVRDAKCQNLKQQRNKIPMCFQWI